MVDWVIPLPISAIENPQSLAMQVGLSPSNTPAVLQIYTGTLTFYFQQTDEQTAQLLSYVPLDASSNLQGYPVPPTAITVVGSLTSLDVEHTTFIGAINTVTVEVEPFETIAGRPQVLVMKSEAAVRNGGVGRIAYQVTVLTDLSTLPNGLAPSVFKPPRSSEPDFLAS